MSPHNPYEKIAANDAKRVSDEKLKVSFEYLDWDAEEFFFHGMEVKYYQKFFSCITAIKASKERDITEQTHSSLSPKSIFNTDSSIKENFPDAVCSKLKNKLFVQTRNEESSNSQAKQILGRAFEVSLSKSYGRLHGFIWNNIFHVVWFDPAHNLFPMNRGITRHRDAATVKGFCPQENLRLQEIIVNLQSENNELFQMLEDKTDPTKN